jgi:hypothetical protein
MKVNWVIGIASLLFAAGALKVLFQGDVELQPQRVLNPSNFNRPEEIGAMAFRRFWQEFHEEKLFIIGSSPHLKDYDKIWHGLIAVAKVNGVTFDKVFAQEGLRPISAESLPLDWEQIQLALVSSKKILVHLVATDEMWDQTVSRTTGGFILFQSVLPLEADEKNLMSASCMSDDKKFQLGCKSLKALGFGKKKKFDPAQITAVIEKYGLREHVLFVHEK